MGATPLDLVADLQQVRQAVAHLRGPRDVVALRALHLATWLATLVGLGLAAWGLNPLSPLLLALAASTRWMVLGHHVCHGALDGVPTTPPSWQSMRFARGWRRWWHWPDWIEADAWHREHNQLHHAYTNDPADPDLVVLQAAFFRRTQMPMVLRYVLIAALAMTWRWLYYAPNTAALAVHATLQRHPAVPLFELAPRVKLWDPRTPAGHRLWLRSWLPNAAFWMVLLPLPLLALGLQVWATALAHVAIGGLLCNVQTFLVIVPNHAGDDLAVFSDRAVGKAQWLERQIRASCNYRTGGWVNDWLHGWLNYQIEHHLWPNLTLRQYAAAAPLVRAVCRKHGLPYVQQGIFRRVAKLAAVMVGAADQKRSEAPFVHDVVIARQS